MFYVLLLVFMLLIGSFFAGNVYENQLNNKIYQLRNGIDYTQEVLRITDKEKKEDLSDYIYYFFNGRSGGHSLTEYLLYSGDKLIHTDSETFSAV